MREESKSKSKTIETNLHIHTARESRSARDHVGCHIICFGDIDDSNSKHFISNMYGSIQHLW